MRWHCRLTTTQYWRKEQVPITQLLVQRCTSFSGGEKQKISLVRALLKDSEVLILDEPSNHLDQESVRVLKKYLQETKKTVILITHDTILSDVASRCIQIG